MGKAKYHKLLSRQSASMACTYLHQADVNNVNNYFLNKPL